MLPWVIEDLILEYKCEMEELETNVYEAVRLYDGLETTAAQCLLQLESVPSICRARFAVRILLRIAKTITDEAIGGNMTPCKLKSLRRINSCLEFTQLRALLFATELGNDIIEETHYNHHFQNMIPHTFLL